MFSYSLCVLYLIFIFYYVNQQLNVKGKFILKLKCYFRFGKTFLSELSLMLIVGKREAGTFCKISNFVCSFGE